MGNQSLIFLAILLISIFQVHSVDGKSITFTPMSDSTVLYNPERGFYHGLELFASKDFTSSLTISSVKQQIKNNDNISIILVEVVLDKFLSSDISSTVLDKLNSVVFAAIRSVGMKCILRFAYSMEQGSGPQDAAKTQLLKHIAQLKPTLQSNEDVIFVLQAGFIGTWGEWYYTTNYASPSDQSVNSAQQAARNTITAALLDALPSTRMIQLRTPGYKQKYCNTTSNLASQDAFKSNIPCARIGIHNDCFMASGQDMGTFDNNAQRTWLTKESLYVMTGGESCQSNSKTNCAGGIEQVTAQRFTYLNKEYFPKVISGWVNNGCYNTISNMMGYRFQLVSGDFPTSVTRGTNYQGTVSVTNTGVAPLYNQRPVQIILRNTSSSKLSTFTLSKVDPRKWAPGSTVSLALSFAIPSNMPTGKYDVILNLPDASTTLDSQPLTRILMANDGGVQEPQTRYNILSQVNVV